MLTTDRWHNDIKPGNIIVVDGEYKLADPGFAKFKRKLEKDPSSIPTIVSEGGTRTYGTYNDSQ
jgi:serine/threonine protein kinase